MTLEQQEQALSNYHLAESRRRYTENLFHTDLKQLLQNPDNVNLQDDVYLRLTALKQDIRDEVIAEIEYRKYR